MNIETAIKIKKILEDKKELIQYIPRINNPNSDIYKHHLVFYDAYFIGDNSLPKESYKKSIACWIAFYLDPEYPKNQDEVLVYRILHKLEIILDAGFVLTESLSYCQDVDRIINFLNKELDKRPITELIKYIGVEYESR